MAVLYIVVDIYKYSGLVIAVANDFIGLFFKVNYPLTR